MTTVEPSSRAEAPRIMVIERRQGLGSLGLVELWEHRELVAFFVWRDFKVRYRQTALGIAWVLVQPLLTTAVLTLIFSRFAGVSSDGVPYPLFVLAGLLPWQFFSSGTSTAGQSFVINQDLVRRVWFPRMALPLSAVLSGAIDLLVSLPLLAAALLLYDWVPSWRILLLPAAVGLGFVATLGVGLLLAGANARYRDVGYALPFALQIALFASPIAYPSSALPEGWRMVYSLNPMVGVVDGVRWSLFGTEVSVPALAVSVAAALALLVVGAVTFRRVERTLADVL